MSRTVSLCALLLTALFATAAAADVINVPGDYDEIHDAVQAANPGDIVQVAAGTYSDCTHETEGPGTTPACVIMKSGVTLRGAGTADTIIDAQSLGRGIFVENVEDCRIENLQIRNAFAAAYGAGILMRQVGRDVVVTDVLVTLCTDGGVICYNGASPTLTRVDCVSNVAKQGGGLAIEEDSFPWVIDCLIDDNEAPSGAGAGIRNASDCYLTRRTITNNRIDANCGQGGGIFIADP
ncbi:right-handed parallel beta-helix repeat-containing protein, partial [bacterium]|nr:right-handed parallel beta-helix repeat-containing protein [bacterium]